MLRHLKKSEQADADSGAIGIPEIALPVGACAGPASTAPGGPALVDTGNYREEPATIGAHHPSVPRDLAEAFAAILAAAPPPEFTLSQWEGMQGDIGRLLDQGWDQRLAACGWTVLELFGCDRHYPARRRDQLGVLLRLDGWQIVRVSDRAITVRKGRSAEQAFYRRPPQAWDAGRLPPWELAPDRHLSLILSLDR
jgi:hypothetical protein